ncbi:MAG: hypothetical protein HQL94_07735, partial [Magnetococcales bacterium]|nr:hypothetical protein [Magnetococcales bacterium]
MTSIPPPEMREWLIAWSGTFLGATAVLILLAAILNLDTIRQQVQLILPGRMIRVVPVILLGGALATGFLAPQTHRIYYDETIYLSIGQNLAHLNRAQTCHSGGDDYGRFRCDQGEYNKQPNGFPFLASVVFRLFGTSETAIFILNNLLLGGAALAVLFLAIPAGGSWLAGVFAALIVILIPQNLHWYNTTAAEPSSAFFAAVTILAAFYYRRMKTPAALTLLTTLTAFSIQFRPESLLLPLLLIPILGKSLLANPRALLANLLLFFLLTLPLWLHFELFHNHPWGSTGTPFSMEYFQTNLAVNGMHYLDNKEFPLLFSLLAICGVIWPGSHHRERALLALWFLLFWGVFLFFYAGSYHYGADMRFSLLSALPLALLAGLGAEKI